MKVVISQSMYFPWVGLLEQLRLSDVFVHYDDVQFTRGFFNRVQIKMPQGTRMLTVPLRDQHRGQSIDEARIDSRQDWRRKHRDLLASAYAGAPYRDEMLKLVEQVFSFEHERLSDLSRASVVALGRYFGLCDGRQFADSRTLNIGGSSSQRLLDIVVSLGGDTYITGHGARNYLDHSLFERSGVEVEYISYRLAPYAQLHGAFTPFVSALDLVANCGAIGRAMICSGTTSWREQRS